MKKIWPKLVKVSASLHRLGGGGCSLAADFHCSQASEWEMEVTEPASLGVPYSQLAPACSGLSTEEGSRKPGEVVKSFATRHPVSILGHLRCFICPALRWVFALEVIPEERE